MSVWVGGGCLCGSVGFEIQLPTLFCGHCHCSMCRRPHGAPYVTWVGVPFSQFRVVRGADTLRTYASSADGRRQFCGTCGSQMFCWHVDASGAIQVMDVTLASLRAEIDRQPEAHFFFDSRAAWTEVNDALPKLGGPTGLVPLDAVD